MADDKPRWKDPYGKAPWIVSKDSLSSEELKETEKREHPRLGPEKEFRPDPMNARGPPRMDSSAPHLTGRTGISSFGGTSPLHGSKPFAPAPRELLPENKLDRRRVLATAEEGGAGE